MRISIKLVFILMTILCPAMGIALWGQETPDIERVKVIVNGEEISEEGILDVQRGAALVPCRDVFEALGMRFGWDASENAVVARREGKRLVLPIGALTARLDGKELQLRVPTRLENNKAYVHARALGEAFGMKIRWDETIPAVEITAPLAGPELEKVIKIIVNGEELTDQLAMERGRLLAPVVGLSTVLGLGVESREEDWIDVIDESGEVRVSFRADLDVAQIGEKVVDLSTPVRYFRGEIYVPVVDFVDLIGAKRLWIAETQTLEITKLAEMAKPPEIVKPTPIPGPATKILDIITNREDFEGKLVFVRGRIWKTQPPAEAESPNSPLAPPIWLLSDGSASIYIREDVTWKPEESEMVETIALVRISPGGNIYLEPGLAGGDWSFLFAEAIESVSQESAEESTP